MYEAVLLATHIELGGSTQSVFAAEFDSPMPTPVITDGLREVFRRQPMLRARLAGQAPGWRFVFDVQFPDLDIRTTDLSCASADEVLAAECDNPLDLERGPLWRILLGTDGSSGAGGVTLAVVTFAHAIVDGVSVFAFLQQLLAAVNGRARGAEPFQVRPPLESGLPPAVSEDAVPVPPAAGQWPFAESAPIGQRRTNIVRGRIGKEVFEPILLRCRAEGVKVEGFFTASIQGALAHTSPAALSLPVLSTFDARTLMDPSVPRDEMGLFMKDIQLFDAAWQADGLDVWERARSVSSIIVEERHRGLAQLAENSAEETIQQIKLVAAYPLDGFAFGFSVSNVGRQFLDRSGPAGLKSFCPGSPDRIGIMGFQVALVEMGGDMHVTFVHTAPLISAETISQLLEGLTEIVQREARETTHA
ncbi:MAG TPA: hypothetical protein VGS19_09245 [Streptosporangiaceae bacterium]|nr:hypothetical protein [Streptosporangiaceae bacterium]